MLIIYWYTSLNISIGLRVVGFRKVSNLCILTPMSLFVQSRHLFQCQQEPGGYYPITQDWAGHRGKKKLILRIFQLLFRGFSLSWAKTN